MIYLDNYKLRISDIYLDSEGEKCVNFDFSKKDNEKAWNREYAYFEVKLNEDFFLPVCYDFSSIEIKEIFKKLFVAKSNSEIAEMFEKELEWKRIEKEYDENN